MRRIHKKVKVTQLFPPTDYTTATDGNNTAIDTKGFEEMLLIIDKGIVDNVTLNIDIQHSDEAAANFATLSAPVDTAINPRLLQFVDADDNLASLAYFDLAGLKRYIKPVDTLNANSALYGIIAVLIGPEEAACTQTYEADAT